MRLAIVLLLAATVSASAQSATDNELFAGYCVGASDREQEFEAYKRLPELREVHREMMDRMEREKERFRTYLVARGFGSRMELQAYNAVLTAVQRGLADRKVCAAQEAMCARVCDRPTTIEEMLSCSAKCRANERACVSVDRCSQPNSLPF